jgi:heptosyltransferase-2
VLQSAGEAGRRFYDLTGRTDLGTAIDLLSLAGIVVSNDSGLMHAAAAVGAPLVALFGSSSPVYTPPISPVARIAHRHRVQPVLQAECPLKHFKCMRDPSRAVYDHARTTLSTAADATDRDALNAPARRCRNRPPGPPIRCPRAAR